MNALETSIAESGNNGKSKFALAAVAAALILTLAGSALADGLIVPIRPEHRVMGQWAVKHHDVKITVRDQVASVAIDQEFVNTGSGMLEVEYIFPVPPDAAIDSMTLTVDGKEFAAKLMKADEARKIYEDIVRTKKDPALLEYAGFGMYRTKAFPLQAGKPAKVLVTYQVICKKDHDLVNVWYPLNTEKFSAKPIESVTVKVDMQSKSDIPMVYSPSHDLTTERKDAKHVIATYTAKNVLPSTDFQLFFKEANDEVAATLVTHQPNASKDGYFVMLASPNAKATGAPAAKDVVLVLDRSGSMNGQKYDQVKDAVKYVLKNLGKEDRFTVTLYNDSVEEVTSKMMDATAANVDDVLAKLDHLEASGGTNIDEALQTAFKRLSDSRKEGRPQYVIFMTDGLPTVGKTDDKTILTDAKAANQSNARLFAFGVGYDVNVKLLDKLADENRGRTIYVKPKENIEAAVSSLYSKIKNPVMTDLKMEIKGLRLRDPYPKNLPDLFEGDQIVVAGRYFHEDADKLAAADKSAAPTVKSTQLIIRGTFEGKERVFEYPVSVQPNTGTAFGFVDRLWAMRRIGYLLEQIQQNGQKDNKELIDELVNLSKEYGILTPYTSFLADETRPMDHGREILKAGQMADDAGKATGGGSVALSETHKMLGRGNAPAAPAGTSYGYKNEKDLESGEGKQKLDTVRDMDGKAAYRKGEKLWIAPSAYSIDPDKDKAKIKTIERFTADYFDLVKANTQEENKVLSTQQEGEELLVVLRGQAYLIK